MEQNQFDTVYHEHWSYLSLGTTQRIFAEHGLEVFDVEELWTHGGSLRLFIKSANDAASPSLATSRICSLESVASACSTSETYAAFSAKVDATKRKLLQILIEAKDAGKSSPSTAQPVRAIRFSTTAGSVPTSSTMPVIAASTSTAGSRRDPHSHLSSRTDRTNEAGLRPDPAVEPEGRNHEPTQLHR